MSKSLSKKLAKENAIFWKALGELSPEELLINYLSVKTNSSIELGSLPIRLQTSLLEGLQEAIDTTINNQLNDLVKTKD